MVWIFTCDFFFVCVSVGTSDGTSLLEETIFSAEEALPYFPWRRAPEIFMSFFYQPQSIVPLGNDVLGF